MLPPSPQEPSAIEELRAEWPSLGLDERLEAFERLPRDAAAIFFQELPSHEQAELVLAMPEGERYLWLRLLAPDDTADLLQEVEPEQRQGLIPLLDSVTQKEVTALLAYKEDEAGGLMSPRFARVRPDMTVEEAISYLRRQSRHLETIYYVYVLDSQQRLLGVVSFRELLSAPAGRPVSSIMQEDVIAVPESLDQEAVAQLFRQHGFLALPVVDESGRVQGIVTSDDIVDVLHEEATEDIQKIGGMEALDTPYLRTPFFDMVRKRAGWLTFLFFGGTLTASAMGYFEAELSRAVVLALFLPLIIASGGNAGAQATTLVIRAMALGEVRLGDWWRVVRREFLSGLALGLLLACVAMVWVTVWEFAFGLYGEHFLLVGLSVAISLVGVVTWGTLAGSTLPFALRRLNLDPASASAPFVATLVDVAGVLIYFTVARWVLAGTLL